MTVKLYTFSPPLSTYFIPRSAGKSEKRTKREKGRSAFDQFFGLARDDELFVRRDDKHFDAGIFARDVVDAAVVPARVLLGIERDAEIVQPLADHPAHFAGVLADARRKDEAIQPVHRRRIGADVLLDAVRKHVEGELRALVPLVGGLRQVAEVARNARDTGDTALLVQIRDAVDERIALLFREIFEHGGIDVARARSHNNALKWSEPHGSVHTFAVFDCSD